ncbi:hypothetical protein L9F63_008811, partial [Diploptera punctata]
IRTIGIYTHTLQGREEDFRAAVISRLDVHRRFARRLEEDFRPFPDVSPDALKKISGLRLEDDFRAAAVISRFDVHRRLTFPDVSPDALKTISGLWPRLEEDFRD